MFLAGFGTCLAMLLVCGIVWGVNDSRRHDSRAR